MSEKIKIMYVCKKIINPLEKMGSLLNYIKNLKTNLHQYYVKCTIIYIYKGKFN